MTLRLGLSCKTDGVRPHSFVHSLNRHTATAVSVWVGCLAVWSQPCLSISQVKRLTTLTAERESMIRDLKEVIRLQRGDTAGPAAGRTRAYGPLSTCSSSTEVSDGRQYTLKVICISCASEVF